MQCSKCDVEVILFYKNNKTKSCYYYCASCNGVQVDCANTILYFSEVTALEALPSNVYQMYAYSKNAINMKDCVHRCLNCNEPIINIGYEYTCMNCGFSWEVCYA
jgi:hypothetical protein